MLGQRVGDNPAYRRSPTRTPSGSNWELRPGGRFATRWKDSLGLPRVRTGTSGVIPVLKSVQRYMAVPQNGGDRFQMQDNLDRAGRGHLVPACWRNKPRGTTDVFGRLWWDRPALTIRTEFFKPEKGRYLHPSEDRPITIREAARLMSFSDSFVFPETQSMTSVARQVGNAVPPLLARQIAIELGAQLMMGRSPVRGRALRTARSLTRRVAELAAQMHPCDARSWIIL